VPVVIFVTSHITLPLNTNFVPVSSTTGILVAVIEEPVKCIFETNNVFVSGS
jgi:hypothetical protein